MLYGLLDVYRMCLSHKIPLDFPPKIVFGHRR